MGKGDKKSKKGKIAMGSFGNSRLKKNEGPAAKKVAVAKEEPATKEKK
jgi:ribosomal small subunit protein bTHX